MRITTIGLLALTWTGLFPTIAFAEPSGATRQEGSEGSPRRPNVVVILTDDQGSADLGCYGSTDLETPHVDGLAGRGIRFTQFYAAAPVCSPSRAGLLTGRYPVRAGVPGNVSSTSGRPGMPTEQVTMAEAFADAGYATAQIGKWHLGYTPETMPGGQGFDVRFGHMGGCIDNYSHFFYWNGPNRHDLWRNGVEIDRTGRFFPDLMVEEASAFIHDHKDQPFFIYFAINVPHYPYQGDLRWLEHYRDLPYPRNLYAAFVSTLDERIGRLLGVLDQLGLRDDTIVVYQSDHGHSVEVRAHNGGGSSGGLRGAKFSMFEGGIRVPSIISWPGHLDEGVERAQVGHGCDWFPTLLDLCQIETTEALDFDGLSLVPALESAEVPSPHADRDLHWQTGQGPRARWAVRRGPWKLQGNPLDPTDPDALPEPAVPFLSNIDTDPTESTNLADQHPEIVEQLMTSHESWIESVTSDKPTEVP